MATLKDIAARAGVTHSIVSRTLSCDPTLRINEQTRQKILKAAKELRYTPNVAARALRNAKPQTIAMAMHDITNPIFAQIFAGAQAAAEAKDYSLFIGEVDSMVSGEARLNTLIKGGAIEGLILLGIGSKADETACRMLEGNRLVCLQEEPSPLFGCVQLADKEAARIATQHLLDLGHTRIGMLSTARSASFSRRRVQGWRETMRGAGLNPPDSWVEWAGSDVESGRFSVHELLRRAPDLTALVVGNVMEAIGTLTGLRQMSKSVPDDISVVALFNTPLALHVDPVLTTVELPLSKLGYEAARLLLDDEAPDGKLVVISDPAPNLLVRASTAPIR